MGIAPADGAAITMAPFAAGISNQKLAFVGLLRSAQAENRNVVLPELVQFIPEADDHSRCLFEDLFDIDVLRRETGVPFIDAVAHAADPSNLFHHTMASIGEAQEAGALLQSDAVRLAAALHPASHRRPLIEDVARRFRARGGRIACQMRVEPDWQDYIDKRLFARLAHAHDLTTQPLDIAAKIVATFGTDVGPVLITCDEARLQARATLAEAIRAATGLTVLFKSDLLDGEELPTDPLGASLLDFELMTRADVMVGTTLSSFFGLAALTRLGRVGVSANAWVYNALGPALVRRTDDGAFANVGRATGGAT